MSMIPPLGAQQPPTDEEQAAAALAAIEQQIQGLGQEPQQPMGPPGFLERLFTSGAGEPSFTPMGFGSGLLQGLAGGLASRGQKVAQKRQQVEALIEQQRQANAQQQLKDLEASRAAALKTVSDIQGEKRSAKEKQSQFLQDNPPVTQADIKAGFAPPFMLGQPAPLSWRKPETAGSGNAISKDDVSLLADAIEQGLQPPDTKGLYRLAGPVKAELQRRKYDYRAANLDWLATNRTISTLNGPQQTRLRQAANTAYDSLDTIDSLSDRLNQLAPSFRGTVPVLNRASLSVLKSLPGEAGSVARQLDAQITDVTSELGNVYMGGNSPTDHALQLAAKNLSSNWSYKQLKDATDLARRNLSIRRNSIMNSTPINPATMSPSGDVRPPLSTFQRP